MASLEDIGVSALINIISAFAFLLAFAVLRIQPINDRVYFPKWYINGVRSSPRHAHNFVGKFVNLDLRTYVTFLNWMPRALKMKEPDIIEHAGLDSAVFLRIYVLGLKIFGPITVAALLLLVPVNVSGGTLFFLSKDLVVSDIDKLSISNIQPKSLKFFAHISMMYAFTFWICYMLYKEYDTVSSMRLSFIASKNRRAEQFMSNLSKGDIVLILLPKVIVLSVLYLGAVVSTLNPLSTFSEVKKQTLGVHVKFAFVGLDKAGCLTTLGVDYVVVPEHVGFEVNDVRFSWFRKLVSCDYRDYELVMGRNIMQDDTAVILYSSGTTGASKGVVLTHRNLISAVELYVRFEASQYEFRPEDNVYLAVIPMFHIYGLTLFGLGILSLGSKVVVMKRFGVDEMVRSVERYGVTHFPGVPPLVVALTRAAKGGAGGRLKSLKQVFCGAAPLSTRVIEEFMHYFPQVDFIQGYGMSESTAVGTRGFNTRDVHNYMSAGLLAPNMQAKVVDLVTGLYLPPGKTGELWLCGPAIMKEYLNDTDATSSTIDKDGWLHTGDIVYFDQDGYLHIVGRVKEIIKYKGFQIAPADLEDVLATHPAILDAAVTGVRDEEAGEIPVAVVVTSPGAEASESSIIDFVAKQVAPYKKVRRVIFTNMIPRSAAGKILRRELKDQLYSRL